MFDRRVFLKLAGVASVLMPALAFAADGVPFTRDAFAAAQKADKPILIEVHATWCPTCKAQQPIIGELISQPKFKDMTVLRIDFDSQKDIVRALGAQAQSTLIVFKGAREVGRSVGDTRRDSIASLLEKSI